MLAKVTAEVVNKFWLRDTSLPETVSVRGVVPPATENPSALEVKDKPLTVLLVSASLPASVANVPVVGRVTVVDAVVVSVSGNAPDVVKASAKETLFPAASVIVSVPPNVITLSSNVVEPLAVRILPVPRVNVPVPVVIVFPLSVPTAALPVTFKLPVISNVLAGAEVPMPTNPVP